MAKKSRRTQEDESPEVDLQGKDIETMDKLQSLASRVVDAASKMRDPHLDVPSRSLSNAKFNPRKRFIEMGNRTNRRELFNLNQAKMYMQTILAGSGCSKLLRQGKSTSIRGLYYMLKHTIDGTKEETFDDQSESDAVIEDLEVLSGALREELHLYAQTKGALVGPITFEDSGDTIDASKMGSGGYAIPSIVEPDVIKFKKCDAKFILHVERIRFGNDSIRTSSGRSTIAF